MEMNTSLLTGFVKKLRILDKEFRSTQAAQAYVEKECGSQLSDERFQAMEKGYSEASEQMQRVWELQEQKNTRLDRSFREYEERKNDARVRLGKCRLLQATARNVSQSLVSGAGADASGQSGTVDLEALLTGKVDLIAMAGEVNGLFRAGQTRSAQTAAARFEATRRAAERLLTAEIARLETLVLGTWNGRWELADEEDGALQEEIQFAAEGHFEALERWSGAYADQLRVLAEDGRRELSGLPGKRAERVERITSAFLSEFRPSELAEAWRDARDSEPNWGAYRCPGWMPEKLYLAGAECDLSGLNLCGETRNFLEKHYPFLTLGSKLSIPWGLDLGGDGNYEFKYAAKRREQAVKQAREMALRMIAMMPPGKLEITFVDPVTLGESFALFGRLADAAQGDANGRIWSAPGDVERRLADLTARISQINQRCLQGRYANLAAYNRESGREPEGFRVLMLMDYPAGLSEQGLKSLEQIGRLGPKCGVFTVVWRSEEQMKKLPDKLRPMVSNIRAGFRLMNLTDDGQITFDLPKVSGRSFVWRGKPTAAQEQLDEVFRTLWMGM